MSKFKLTILAFGLGGVAAVTFWFHQHPPGLTIIDPTRPPEPILEPTEVEKIHILQNTKEVFLRGGISPDDTSILVVAGTSEDSGQASWLNLDTRQFEAIDSKLLEFFPQGEIAWSSDQNALYLSNNANGDPVLVTLQRETGEIQV